MKSLITSITILLLLTSLSINTAFAQGPPKISLDQAVVNGDIDRVKSEIAAGVDLNSKNRMGWTILHIAVNKKHAEIAKLIIDKGADVNIRDTRGRRPIHLAVETGQKDIVEALIAKGADINAIDGRAENALTLAKKNNQKEITDLLLKNGAEEPDLQALQGDRLYGMPGGSQGTNYNQGSSGRYQAQARSMTTSQSSAQLDILADPNEIKTRVKKFDGLDKELKVVADKSQSELRLWPQARYDNRTTLARSIDKQFEEELQYVRKVAVEESAKKTTEAIDNMLSSRRKRSIKVSREILKQKKEMRLTTTTSTRSTGRGRTSGRSTRGQYSQRGQTSGASTTDNLYGSGAANMPRGYGSQNPARPTEQLDPQTEEQIRLWLQTTPDKKLELARAVHPLIQSEMSSIRAIAVEEEAKKTTAAIDGLLLSRKERFDKLVVKMEEDLRKLQAQQSMQNPNDPGQAYQQGGRYSGRTRRGTSTQSGSSQQQDTRRTRRR
jgi:hypothetical protein